MQKKVTSNLTKGSPPEVWEQTYAAHSLTRPYDLRAGDGKRPGELKRASGPAAHRCAVHLDDWRLERILRRVVTVSPCGWQRGPQAVGTTSWNHVERPGELLRLSGLHNGVFVQEGNGDAFLRQMKRNCHQLVMGFLRITSYTHPPNMAENHCTPFPVSYHAKEAPHFLQVIL